MSARPVFFLKLFPLPTKKLHPQNFRRFAAILITKYIIFVIFTLKIALNTNCWCGILARRRREKISICRILSLFEPLRIPLRINPRDISEKAEKKTVGSEKM